MDESKKTNSVNQGDGDPMAELKRRKIWMLWRMEKRVNSSGEERLTKVPISASGRNSGTDLKYAGDWMTYEEALAAKEKVTCAGVGFKIPDGVFFLDIDHREPEDPLLQELLGRFHSYAERSYSGKGYHIYGMADVSQIPTAVDRKGSRKLSAKYYTKNPNNGLELYFGDLTNRFAVYTGDAVCALPLRDCTAALLETLEKEMRRAGDRQDCGKKRPGKGKETCENLIRQLLRQKNGEKFQKLFEEGDISGYGSQSEADMALCCMIAFRAGDRPEVIDAVFRLSALYREKWEREDYREETIRKAIEFCGGRFMEVQLEKPCFIVTNGRGEEKVSAPLLKQYVEENLQFIRVRNGGTEELMMYVYQNGVYRYFDELMFEGEMKKFIEPYDKTLVKTTVLRETYELLRMDHDRYLSPEELNGRIDLINFRNGLLQIGGEKPVLLPHSPEVLSTIQIPCEWKEEPVPTPVFDAYLDTLCGGDGELRQLLLEFIGAVISNIPGYKMKKALFLVGPGNTGKSQLRALTERLIGSENYTGTDLREIEEKFGSANLYGKRLAGSADMSFMTVSELSTFKKLTGGDSIIGEYKYKQGFTFTYTGLLWFCMNRLPRFGGDNGQWVYDRIMAVECTNVIPPEKQDKDLLEKMFAEREGIIQKAVEALCTVIRSGYAFSEPACVKKLRRIYRDGNSSVSSFYAECMCQKSETYLPSENLTVTQVYRAYKNYCSLNCNGYAKSRQDFEKDLAEILGCDRPSELKKRMNAGVVYCDYTLTPEARREYLKGETFFYEKE